MVHEKGKKSKNARYEAQRCPTPPKDEVAPHFFLHNRVPHPYIGLKIGFMRLPSQKKTFLKFVIIDILKVILKERCQYTSPLTNFRKVFF